MIQSICSYSRALSHGQDYPVNKSLDKKRDENKRLLARRVRAGPNNRAALVHKSNMLCATGRRNLPLGCEASLTVEMRLLAIWWLGAYAFYPFQRGWHK